MDRPSSVRKLRMTNFPDHYQAVRCSWFDDWDFAVSMRYSKYCGFVCGYKFGQERMIQIADELIENCRKSGN